jgi:hypothetical protein
MKTTYTREHFELAAAVIASVANADTRKVLCEEWSLELAKTNQRFNFGTFAKACDVSEAEEDKSEQFMEKLLIGVRPQFPSSSLQE